MSSFKEYLCSITFKVKATDEINAEVDANSAARWMKYDRPEIEIVSCGIVSEVIPNETAEGQ